MERFVRLLLELYATFSKEEKGLFGPLDLPNAWVDPLTHFWATKYVFFEALCMIGLVDMKFEQMIFMLSHDFFDPCIKFMCLVSLCIVLHLLSTSAYFNFSLFLRITTFIC